MSLIYIPSAAVTYQCLSTDISGSKVNGASYKGANLYCTDTQIWYRVLDDLTITPLVNPPSIVTISGSNIDIENCTFSGSITNWPSVYSGSITNFPNTYSGSVTNLPTTYSGSITNTVITSGCITNFPTVYSGSITNLPAIQQTSGCITNTINATSVDEYGWDIENTPLNEGRFIIPQRLVGAVFSGSTIDPNFWTVTSGSVSGSAVQSGNQIILSTGSATNGTCVVQSVRVARYIGGSSNRYRAQIRLSDSGIAGNSRRFGMFDSVDGAYYKVSGTTMYACTMKGGVESAISASNWNVSTASPTLTNVNSYEIYQTNANVYYSVAGNLVHTASFPINTWSNVSHFPARMDTTNTGITSQNNIECRVATIYRLGALQTQAMSNYTSGTTAGKILKYGAGNLQKLVFGSLASGAVVTLYDGVNTGGILFLPLHILKVLKQIMLLRL